MTGQVVLVSITQNASHGLALFSLVSFALHVYNSRRAVFIRLLTILWANNIEGYEGIPEICIYIYIYTYIQTNSVGL